MQKKTLPGHPQAAMDRATGGAGQEIPYRAQMEEAFGQDLSHVRAHLGQSGGMGALEANAAARGNDVAFASSNPSEELVAEEVGHVLQNGGGSIGEGVSSASDASETQAVSAAKGIVGGDYAQAAEIGAGRGVAGASIQRNGIRETFNGDWDRACSAVAFKWERIESRQTAAIDAWYDTAKENDPPPMWQSLLIAAISIGVGAVTGGIGAVAVSKLANRASEFVINAAVEAGKGIVQASAGAAVGAVAQSHSADGLLGFRESQKATINDVVDRQQTTTLGQLSRLSGDDKWDKAQSLYDALEQTRADAYTIQYQECVDGWLRQVAQNAFGTDADGTADQSAIAEDWGTSSLGTLGIKLKPSRNPTQPVMVSYAELEGSTGNNANIRNSLLDRRIDQMRFPKTVISGLVTQGGNTFGGRFSGAWDSQNNWAISSYTGNVISFGSGQTNCGRMWVAARGMGVNQAELTEPEIDANLESGVDQIEQDIGSKSLRQHGISSIST